MCCPLSSACLRNLAAEVQHPSCVILVPGSTIPAATSCPRMVDLGGKMTQPECSIHGAGIMLGQSCAGHVSVRTSFFLLVFLRSQTLSSACGCMNPGLAFPRAYQVFHFEGLTETSNIAITLPRSPRLVFGLCLQLSRPYFLLVAAGAHVSFNFSYPTEPQVQNLQLFVCTEHVTNRPEPRSKYMLQETHAGVGPMP